jgi:heptosyltransferase III
MEVQRGLIIFPGALGDLICLLPALHAIYDFHPKLRLELMAGAELARFAVRRMPIAAGHSIDRREVALLFSEAEGDRAAAAEFFGQFNRIDCFFASDNEHFCSSLTQVAGGSVSFYPFRPSGSGHIAECYLRAIGAPISYPLTKGIAILPDDMCSARQRLEALGTEPGRFVLVLPGSGSARKNWPADKFAVVAERLRSVHPVLVVLGPAEGSLAGFFHTRSLAVLSELELGELAGIAHLARCFIGNDSGVSHLAAATGARGAAIFGPTDPERWRPLGNVTIIHKEPLEDLSTDLVWRASAELL